MFGYQAPAFSPYEEEWGVSPPWTWSMYNRYPVYTRPAHYSAPWLPPGAVQVYGPQHHHQYHHHAPHPQHGPYLEPEFRSNSANLPLVPPVEYVWASRKARRTKSSAPPRQRQYFAPPAHQPLPPHTPPHWRPEPQPLLHHNSFARRFFNDRDSKTDLHKPSSHNQRGSQRQQRILIEPDVHDHQQSLVSQVLVSRPVSSSSLHSDRSRDQPPSAASSYRVISDLLPHNTLNIHKALIDAEYHHSQSCTCYQCQADIKSYQSHSLEKRNKTALNSLASDINSNFIVQGKDHV